MMFGAWGNTDHDESIRIIHRALEGGINFIDTADVYARGESEEIVGKALQGRRDSVVLATKVHGTMDDDDANRSGNSRRWIVEEVENSLRRLQTDWIDLYQIHRFDPWTAHEETLGALTDLQRAGKIRYFGSSTYQPSEIVEAQWVSERRGLGRYVTEQPPYSLLVRGIESEVLPVCARYGLAVIPWSPLAGGWLSGAYRRGAETTSTRASRIPARYDLSLPENQAEARRGRAPRRPGRPGRPHPDPARARLRAPAPGGHGADHRPADDGASREPDRRDGRHAERRRAGRDRRDRAAGDEPEPGRRRLASALARAVRAPPPCLTMAETRTWRWVSVPVVAGALVSLTAQARVGQPGAPLVVAMLIAVWYTSALWLYRQPAAQAAAGPRTVPAGANVAAGAAVFRSAGCGSCHTLAAAGAHGSSARTSTRSGRRSSRSGHRSSTAADRCRPSAGS